MNRYSGKICVVTGAAKGIGLATALRLGREGGHVIAVDLDPEVAKSVDVLKAQGSIGEAVEADCVDREAVERLFADITKKHGRVDLLVNVVGGAAPRNVRSLFHVSDPKTWDFVIDLSLKSTMLCCRQVAPSMRERGSGSIVNIASVAFLAPTPTFADYAAAKAGVVGFTRVLAIEMAPHGVTVNAISPGPIDTPASAGQSAEFRAFMTATVPMGHYGKPEDVAAGVAYLGSDDAAFVVGHNLVIAGGRASI